MVTPAASCATSTSASPANRQERSGAPQARPGGPALPSKQQLIPGDLCGTTAGWLCFISPRHTPTHHKRNTTLLKLLRSPVCSGCVCHLGVVYSQYHRTWKRFIVPRKAALPPPFWKLPAVWHSSWKQSDGSLGNILHVKERNAEKTMLWLLTSQRAHTFLFVLSKNISFWNNWRNSSFSVVISSYF